MKCAGSTVAGPGSSVGACTALALLKCAGAAVAGPSSNVGACTALALLKCAGVISGIADPG